MASEKGAGKLRKVARRQGGKGRPFKPGNREGKKFEPGHHIGRPKLPPGYNEAFDLMEPEAWEALRDIVTAPEHKDRAQTAQYVVNRRRGRPTERVEVGGHNGKPLESEFPNLLGALKKLSGEE